MAELRIGRTRLAAGLVCALIAACGLGGTAAGASRHTRVLRTTVAMPMPERGQVGLRSSRFRVGGHLQRVWVQYRGAGNRAQRARYTTRLKPGQTAILPDAHGRAVVSLILSGRYDRRHGVLRLDLRIKNVRASRRMRLTARVSMAIRA